MSHDKSLGTDNGRLRAALRWLAAALFVAAGLNHFRSPAFYARIVPPGLPNPDLLVALSGACEVAGGLALLVRPLRRAAGWGLVALLVAVFPANLYMALHPDRVPGLHVPQWLLWLRLPLQPVLIAWGCNAPAGYGSSRIPVSGVASAHFAGPYPAKELHPRVGVVRRTAPPPPPPPPPRTVVPAGRTDRSDPTLRRGADAARPAAGRSGWGGHSHARGPNAAR